MKTANQVVARMCQLAKEAQVEQAKKDAVFAREDASFNEMEKAIETWHTALHGLQGGVQALSEIAEEAGIV